jgi:hypothetical protein
MLSNMAQLCRDAASATPEDPKTDVLLTLYRNGQADALYAFNKTTDIYIEQMKGRIEAEALFIITLSATLFGIIV